MYIDKCKGENCKIREKCKRFTAKSDVFQSYLVISPYSDGKCELFLGEEAESIMNQVESIVKNNTK